MNNGQLIDMANQIGQFFETFPDQEEALDGIGDHIRKFWAPPMRRQLVAYLDEHSGDAELTPLVAQALRRHRDALI